jgi:NAD kinase
MKKIGIIAKNIPEAQKAAKKLAAWLESHGKKVFIDSDTAAAIKMPGHERTELFRSPMLIVLGGDGTPSASRLVADAHRDVPIFGVNLGSWGSWPKYRSTVMTISKRRLRQTCDRGPDAALRELIRDNRRVFVPVWFDADQQRELSRA